ncbi:hypothetical protein PVBG_06143 [Plasmodium vivax Brazil I]|uniref:Uncharacterized protein n=1 Tax=Plasmodium vivax (strain Brazil I) TaxID=1033975 RepID=A0A0J9VN30_PLAV1|nr:hypothetical protein PVBG_06143 [Plasmodium vivax Brazil I]
MKYIKICNRQSKIVRIWVILLTRFRKFGKILFIISFIMKNTNAIRIKNYCLTLVICKKLRIYLISLKIIIK